MDITSNETVLPQISVIMAINKYDNYTDKAILSILWQSFRDFEFIIVINGPHKDAIYDSLAANFTDPRIIYLKSELAGLAFSLNLALSQSRGKYIARMDADDISLKDRLSEQANYLDLNYQVTVLGCRIALIDEYDNIITRGVAYYETDEAIRRILPIKNPLIHPALMFRRSALMQLQGYKYGHMSEDHELFLRMARNKSNLFHNLNKVLFYYRRHSEQITDASNMFNHYVEISGFLFTEFLRTKSTRYIIGMLNVHPFIRKLRLFMRQKLYKSSK